jgi:hypothetical protein
MQIPSDPEREARGLARHRIPMFIGMREMYRLMGKFHDPDEPGRRQVTRNPVSRERRLHAFDRP